MSTTSARTPVLKAGLGLLAVAVSGWGGLPMLLIPLFGYSVSLGFTAPNAMANALAHQGSRSGSASAVLLARTHDGGGWVV